MLFSQPMADVVKPKLALQTSVSSQVMVFDLAGAMNRAKNENAILRAAKAQVSERRGLITSARADALPQLAFYGTYNKNKNTESADKGAPSYNRYNTKIKISQPLFHWGELDSAVRGAKAGKDEADFNYITTELDVLHSVAKAYVEVLIAKAELEITQIRLKTTEQFLANIKAKIEMHTATKLDLLRAESEYLSVFPENLQTEANYKRALELLSSHLALSPTVNLELVNLGLPNNIALPSNLPDRSEISQYKQREIMYRINETAINSTLRPHFDFNAYYGSAARNGSGLFRKSCDDWRADISMSFLLFDGMRTSGKRAQNRAKLEHSIQLRIDKERAISREKSNAERELNKAISFHKAAAKAYDASLEALNTSREFFEHGLIMSLDLLKAEHTERKQESQRRRAELGIWTALFEYRRSYGLPPI